MTKAVTKQRLQKLENEIKKAAEEIQRNGIEIGKRLIEIRDNELWKDDYDSWSAYLKDRSEYLVGKSNAHAKTLIETALIARKMPVDYLTSNNLSTSSVTELRRLAPTVDAKDKDSSTKPEKDFNKIRKGDIDRVLKTANKIAKDQGKDSPSVRDVREAVDRDLGIDRKAEAKKKREQEEREQQIDLSDYLRERSGTIEGIHDNLSSVPAQMWDALQEQNSEVVERFTASLERLLDFMRG